MAPPPTHTHTHTNDFLVAVAVGCGQTREILRVAGGGDSPWFIFAVFETFLGIPGDPVAHATLGCNGVKNHVTEMKCNR